MGTRDTRIDDYIARAAPFSRPILKRLRRIVHLGCPDVQETIKWGVPHFEHRGVLCSMAAFTQHCAFGFWKASLLGAGGAGSGEAMGQVGRIASTAELPDEKQLVRLVRKAATLNEQGVKPPARRGPARPALAPPADLLAALRKDRRALATFDGFSPSHRREYVEWILEAKRDETRRRRIETAVAWMAEGKSRNWKYARSN